MFIPFQPAAIPAPRQPPITCNFYQRSPVVVPPIMCGVGTYYMNIHVCSSSSSGVQCPRNDDDGDDDDDSPKYEYLCEIYIYTFFFYPIGGSVVFPYCNSIVVYTDICIVLCTHYTHHVPPGLKCLRVIIVIFRINAYIPRYLLYAIQLKSTQHFCVRLCVEGCAWLGELKMFKKLTLYKTNKKNNISPRVLQLQCCI